MSPLARCDQVTMMKMKKVKSTLPHASKLDSSVMKTLDEVLSALPNVSPRSGKIGTKWAEKRAQAAMCEMVRRDINSNEEDTGEDWSVEIEDAGVTFTTEEAAHLRYQPHPMSRLLCSPYAVGLLIAMYQAGLLFGKTQKNRDVGEVANWLYTYGEQATQLYAKSLSLSIEEQKKAEAYDAQLAHPESIPVSAFNYRLLNDVFVANLGLGGGTKVMVIGGVEVSKTVRVRTSNSGKSRDSEVTFTYVDSDGETVVLEKESIYSGNRRNDANRNHGLPGSRGYK